MMNVTHQVVTKDSPENLNRGIMVCGIDFGFSLDDEKNESDNTAENLEEKSYFPDPTVRKTDKFRKRVLHWLALWGISLESDTARMTYVEHSYFQTNWLDVQNRSNSGPVDLLVENSKSFLSLVSMRKPRIMLLFGANLIEALNDIRIRAEVESVLGSRPGNAVTHRRPAVNGGKVFKVLVQEWPNSTVICLPHPTGSRGVSDDYIAQFKDMLNPLLTQNTN